LPEIVTVGSFLGEQGCVMVAAALAEQGFVAPNGLPYSASAVQSMVGE
jgi:hypothetical protein